MKSHSETPQNKYQSYKNRWVAEVRHRVVGVGLNAKQAYRAAKQNCPKDRPALLFIDETGAVHIQPDNFDVWFDDRLLKKVVALLQQRQQEAYLVGGAVRDGLLGIADAADDLDLLVPKNALEEARALANDLQAAYFPIDSERDVGRVVLPDQSHIDITSYRGESLFEDLQLRDFTINAIALSLDAAQPRIIDPLSGQIDLGRKIIRVAMESAIASDPLRAIRGVRQAIALGFSLETKTEALLSAGGPALAQVSPERIRDEMMKLMQVPQPGQAIAKLEELGLLVHILPPAEAMLDVEQSTPHHLPVFEHTLLTMDIWRVVAPLDDSRLVVLEPLKDDLQRYFERQLAGNLSRASLMPLAALLHDIGKPATFKRGSDARIRFWGHPKVGAKIAKRVMIDWRFSGQAVQFVTAVVQYHMRPLLLSSQKTVSKRAIHRLLEATGDAAPAIALFSLMDHLAIYPPGTGSAEWQRLLEVVSAICRVYFSPKPPVLITGSDLLAQFDLKPGPQIGKLLGKVKETQAVGDISSKEEALQFVASLLEAGE